MAAARRGHSRRHRQDRPLRPQCLEQFRDGEKTVDAVVRNLEIIGEAVRHLLNQSAELPSAIPWSDIAGMRNILVHVLRCRCDDSLADDHQRSARAQVCVAALYQHQLDLIVESPI